MKNKYLPQVIVLLALLVSFIPANAGALLAAAPPADMFQWPWPQGEAWIAMNGFDNGTKRPPTSPHNYQMGGAVDFAPHVGMRIGEDTSNFWVSAAAAGSVVAITSCYMKIDHGNGWTTEYQHLDNIQVAKGDYVYRNQRLANIANSQFGNVCPGNEFPGPHLHFVMRPKMIDTTFSGWSIKYNVTTNVTTFVKGGQTLGSFQLIMNLPVLQIALREPIVWDTLYVGSVDAYRYERWPLQLSETTKFTVITNPVTSGLTPVVVLLDSSGNEIARGTGTLTSTQPAGSYFVQIQAQAGNGFYSLLAKRDDLSGLTPTPTPTSTSLTPTTTPTPGTPTATPTSLTPTATSTPGTPTPTPTSLTPTATSTPGTPTATPTSLTPTATSTPGTPTATPTSLTPTPTSTTPTATPTSLTPTPTSTTPTATPTSLTPTATPTSTTPTAPPTSLTPTPTSTTPTATPTSLPPTATATSTTPTATPTSLPPTATATSTTPTATPTSLPPTATATSTTPTATPTSLPPTATPTSTTPTATPTSLPPTATPTSLTPTATPTSLPPTATPTSLTPTATPTSTTPTATPTSLTPTATPTSTPLPANEPSVSTIIIPTSINVGGVATVNVNLNNIPVGGYTSAEFTCTYNPALVEVSNIVVTNLFGPDPVAAINGPQNGSFILAIAGSNGNRATVSGTAFTFSAKGLQAGQAVIECTARVIKGDNILVDIPSTGAANLTIGSVPTVTPTPLPTFTPTPLPAPVITGQVLASKPVTIRLYNPDNSLAATLNANPDGTFNFTAPAGTYTITATASGFLSAQGSITLTNGNTRTMSTVTLPSGDIDGNGVIDQFDAMTIGMSYNSANPPAADLNNDGTIDVLDLELLAANYRKAGAVVWQ